MMFRKQITERLPQELADELDTLAVCGCMDQVERIGMQLSDERNCEHCRFDFHDFDGGSVDATYMWWV